MPPTPLDYTLTTLRVLLGAWLGYTGGVKVFGSGLEQFAADVANYRVFQDPWNVVTAWFLAWLEIVTGLLLLAGVARTGALWSALGMTVAFMLGIGQAWARGLDINCGCFGGGDETTNYPLHFAMLVLQLALVVFLLGGREGGRRVFRGRQLRLPE